MIEKKSKTAVVLTAIYLLLVVAAYALMLMAKQDESLSGIFVVMVAMPWPLLLSWFTDALGIDSTLFNMIVLALFCILNAFIIYITVSFFSRLFRSKT